MASGDGFAGGGGGDGPGATMPSMGWQAVAGAAAGLLVVWLGLLLALWRVTPERDVVRAAARLLPDVVRLLTRLARDPALPRGLRVRLWLLLAYLAMPFDVIPDVIPVLGQADDAVLVVWTLRSVVRLAGADAVGRHWSGTPDGLRAVTRLAGLPRS